MRSVEYSCSSENNHDSNCYLESTDDWYFRLRNDLYCVEWGVKLYSLTHSRLIFLIKNRTSWCRQWRWYRQYWNSILASLESESWQCGTLFFCSLLNFTLFNTYCFSCFPVHSNCIACSHHRFITLKDCLVVIAVVRNLDNICIL